MWFWIIVIAVVIGGIMGYVNSDGDSSEAAGGAIAGGCMAAGCIGRIALAVLGIFIILWLFGVLFG